MAILEIVLVALAISIIHLAFKEKDIFVYVVSAVITSVMAFIWVDSYVVVAIAIYGLGLYQLFLAVTMALSGESGRGADWFKSMAGKIKGIITK